jgi:hypothetical protein
MSGRSTGGITTHAVSSTGPEQEPASRSLFCFPRRARCPLEENTLPEIIRVRPLADPVIDTLGHDPRSLYVETFWLPTLGPTALLLMRHLASRFEEHPEGTELAVAEAAQSLGLGAREGRSSPLRRSFNRLVQFDLAVAEDEDSWAVRRRVPPVNRRHVRRLPAHLQQAHAEWATAALAEAPLAAVRRNARSMALTLTELGEDLDRVERILHAAGFHPAICRESASWAWERHRREIVEHLVLDGQPG